MSKVQFNVSQLTPSQETIYKAVLNHPNGTTCKELSGKLSMEISGVSKHLNAIHLLGGLTRNMEKGTLIYSIPVAGADTPKAEAKDTTKKAKAEPKAKAEAKPVKEAKPKAEPKPKKAKAEKVVKEKAAKTKDAKPAKVAKDAVVTAAVETAQTEEVVVDKRKVLKTELRGRKPLGDKSKIAPDAKYLKADGTVNNKKVSTFQRGDIVSVPNRFSKETEKAVVVGHDWDYWQGKFYTIVVYLSDNKPHFALTSKLEEAKAKVSVKEILEAHAEPKVSQWKIDLNLKALAKAAK